MNETTVELLFGTKAGIVWKALNKNGPSNIDALVKATSLSREEVYGALGWLGREDKIVMKPIGRAIVFSLREAEVSSAAVKSAKPEDTIPQEQIHIAKSMQLKPIKGRAFKTSTLILDAVKSALAVIHSEFEAGREPTPGQVSKSVGINSRQLGIVLSKLGIKSKSINRGGKCFRIYPIGSKARACELSALDTDELLKISESNNREVIPHDKNSSS